MVESRYSNPGVCFYLFHFFLLGTRLEPVRGLGGGAHSLAAPLEQSFKTQFSRLTTAGQRHLRRPDAPNVPSSFRTFKRGHPAVTAQWRRQVTHETKLFKSFSFISQTFPAHLLVIKRSGAADEQKGPFLSALTHSTPPCLFERRRVPA